VKARHLIGIVAGLALTGAVLFLGFGVNRQTDIHPVVDNLNPSVLAASKAEAVPAGGGSAAGTTNGSAVSNTWATRAVPVAGGEPGQVGGVSDIDPRRAFGSKSAPIVVEVFSDFQCPACKQLYKTTNQPLVDNYVNTNKVYLVHRDFPLPMHAYSRVAARYVRAAAQLGKAEQAENALYSNQEKWEKTGDIDGTLAAVLSSAEMTKIRAQAKGAEFDAVIDKDVALGKTYNVNQTPTTVIHFKGQTYPVVGMVSYDVLRQFLDQLLSQR
jgi:protein-disulfide isomerase